MNKLIKNKLIIKNLKKNILNILKIIRHYKNIIIISSIEHKSINEIITKELLKQVKQIEIRTRGLVNEVFSGEYHSVFKGRGMEFSEVREYDFGDDIRNIDWNVTARFGHPYVKIFEEERELTVMLLIDVSRSNEFGTQKQLKQDLITEIAAVLAFSAIKNKDCANIELRGTINVPIKQLGTTKKLK